MNAVLENVMERNRMECDVEWHGVSEFVVIVRMEGACRKKRFETSALQRSCAITRIWYAYTAIHRKLKQAEYPQLYS